MEITNCTSFHYLVLAMDIEFKQLPIIQEFEECINDYSTMCGCNEEARSHKKNECELKYQDIVLNQMDQIKPLLLNYHHEFTFSTIYPEEKFLVKISIEQ